MITENPLPSDVFSNLSPIAFEQIALEVFRKQAIENTVYNRFLRLLKKDITQITSLQSIPFMPVSFFKNHIIVTGMAKPEITFSSSGTTAQLPARHHVSDVSIYRKSFLKGFEMFYGPVHQYCVLALLPSYLERSGSSLTYMVKELMNNSGHPNNGFFLYNHNQLAQTLQHLEAQQQKTLLIGVSFALLDFVEKYPQLPLRHTIVMETGGMKGRRDEITRDDLHQNLSKAFGLSNIHSEYGMTELLSQAYSPGGGRFRCPPWMRVFIRDIYDPFEMLPAEQTGCINVIDLANIHSCSFIATDDIGRLHHNETFEVLGRLDNADIRGCNLMVSN